MEIQLQELIEQIKKEGVVAAETQAAEILDNAKKEAERIVSSAKEEAERTMLAVKAENDRVVKAGEDALRQAGRNLLLSFRESIVKELNAVIGENVAKVFSADSLADIVKQGIVEWTKNPDAVDFSVLLNEKDLEKAEQEVLAGLKGKITSGIILKPSENFDGGFRIAVNGGQAYYDYSTEAVIEMLSAYLSPKVVALLKEAE